MATYAKLDNSKPVNYARAVRGRPPNQESRQSYIANVITSDAGASGMNVILDQRFDDGGSTTWERLGVTG